MFLLALWLAMAGTFPAHQTAGQAAAAQSREKPEPRLQENIVKWLAQGEHQDIPWKVKLEKPFLTFQLRELIKATAKIDARTLQSQSQHRNLTFIIKVADENHQWLPGENFITQEFGETLGSSTDVQMDSEVLLRPGKYTIATIMYDSVLGQHNVAFLPIEVPRPKNDPFPGILEKAPAAEFVRGDVQNEDTFGDSSLLLPLRSRRPVQLELLVDVSLAAHQARLAPPPFFSPRGDFPRPPHRHDLSEKSYVIHLLQAASVLGAIKVENGCMLVSSFDAIKEKVKFAPTPAAELDWKNILNAELGPDKDTISVSALAGGKEVPNFVLGQFDRMVNESSCLPRGQTKPLRVVLVIGHGVQFPDGSHKIKLEACDCKLFYLRLTEAAVSSDDLKSMMSTLGPQVLDFERPEQFRQKLADLIHAIEQAAQ